MQLILTLLIWVLAPAPSSTPKGDDLLGDIVVEATDPGDGGPRLMRIVVPPVEGAAAHTTRVDEILRRDLDISGQFALLDADKPASLRAAEALVRFRVESTGAGMIEVRAKVFFDLEADVPAYEKSVTGRITETRRICHALVDDVMGALTGYRGPFVSRLTFVVTRGDIRSVHVIDPDGFGLRRITEEDRLVSATAIGPEDAVYYSASIRNGRYRLYRGEESDPLSVLPPGSIYGIAFSPDRSRVALTIAMGRDIRLYAGPSDLSSLRPVGDVALALSPAISARGRIAASGATRSRPRIWIDGRAASPAYASASSPTFCEHPDGTKLAYALGTRQRSHIVVADARGRNARQVTRDRGRHSHPACSPDGRLIAYFSDRRTHEGPGLYIMRVDGHRPRKIANIRGDSLQWARIGESAAPASTNE